MISEKQAELIANHMGAVIDAMNDYNPPETTVDAFENRIEPARAALEAEFARLNACIAELEKHVADLEEFIRDAQDDEKFNRER